MRAKILMILGAVLIAVLAVPEGLRAQFPAFTILDDTNSYRGTAYLGSTGPGFSNVGAALAGEFDADGNGIPDILVGAPGITEDRPGHAFLILDRASRPREIGIAGDDRIITIHSGSAAPDRLGAAVGSAGDVDLNGDGFDDFLVGIPESAEAPGGAVLLIFGRRNFPQNINTSNDLPQLGLLFFSNVPQELTGAAVGGVGDVNGDGVPDFAIGAPGAIRPGEVPRRTGRIHLIFGGEGLRNFQKQGTGRMDLANLPAEIGLPIYGAQEGSLFGFSLDGAGDLDGDGFEDFSVGAPGAIPGGEAYVIFGAKEFSAPDLTSPDGDRAFLLTMDMNGAELGAALAGGLDVTGDEAPDLLLGAPGARRDENWIPGSAVLLSGGRGLRGKPQIDLTIPQEGIVHLIGGPVDHAGAAVALVPDTGGDGIGEILIGGPQPSMGGGVAYLVYGTEDLNSMTFLNVLRPPQGAVFRHNGDNALAGAAVAGLGDRNGDGRGDLAIGAPGREIGLRSGGGAAYEVFSPSSQPERAPQNLSCRVIPNRRVLASWTNSNRYRLLTLLRDDIPIATLPGDALFSIDTNPLPGEHTYRVQADGDPQLISDSCKVLLITLPPEDLICEQLPGTTQVLLLWSLGDRYGRLVVEVNGEITAELPGNATSHKFDKGPGIFEVVVRDPDNPGVSPVARCQLSVIPFTDSPITGFTCALVSAGEKSAVDLHWDGNPDYSIYLILRNGIPLDRVEGTDYRDQDPPAGMRVYQVIGFTENLHPSKPAICTVEIPGPGGNVVRGRITFEDLTGTPIKRGTVKALNGDGNEIGAAQAGEEGRFGIPMPPGETLALLIYTVRIPSLDGKDPIQPFHEIQVEVPAGGEPEVEIKVPLPVIAVLGLQEKASRWKGLLENLENLQGGDGWARGSLAFGFDGETEIARSARSIQMAAHQVRSHLQRYLSSAPRQLDLMAHGFSGLGARAYLHSASPEGQSIRSLILLGTPNLGTNLAILDAHAAAPERMFFPGPKGRKEDLFTASQEQFPDYLREFNKKITTIRGTLVHLVAGLGGASALDPVLGCAEHDGRTCKESAHGGIPGAFKHTTRDTHESLGRSAGSIELISSILLDPEAAQAVPLGGGGGGEESPIQPGELYVSVLTETTGDILELYSDTTGSVIIILNNELPGSIDFSVEIPDGTMVDPASAGALPGVSYYTFGDGEGHQIQAYEFESGQIGTYTAYIENPSLFWSVPYSIQIFLDSNVLLSGNLDPTEVAIGEPVILTAELESDGSPILGAEAEARITRPDGGYEVFTLLDDGQGEDRVQGDGIYTGLMDSTPISGLYLVRIRASGTQPFPFLREENHILLVRSSVATFLDGFTSGGADLEPDGLLEGIWLEGSIQADEAGTYMVLGTLTDLDGNLVANSGELLDVEAPGVVVFRILFDGKDILGSGLDGPYILKKIELLDGNRGFILSEVKTDAHVTEAYTLSQFDPTPNYVRGDVNEDMNMDLSDAVAILMGLFSGLFEITCKDAANANADQNLDITDAIFILEVLFMNGAPIPHPHPACGKAAVLGCEHYDPCP